MFEWPCVGRAESLETENGNSVLRMELMAKSHKRMRMVFEFDASKSFVPTFWARLNTDGSMTASAEVEYEQLRDQPNQPWFPKVATAKVFWKKGLPVARGVEGWTQKHRFEVHDLEINGKVDEREFAIDYPSGTGILDEIRSTRRFTD
jgi:hypothetical protein